MDYETFVELIETMTGTSRQDAERTIHATVQTLAERISKEEVQDLAEELPDELVPWLHVDSHGEAFGLEEFIRRVAEREGVDQVTAEQHVRSFFLAFRRMLSPKELEDIRAQLPQDLRLVIDGLWIVTADEFVHAVSSIAGIDHDDARRVTHTVLETLASRLPSGEVSDLIARLPLSLEEALKRGDARRNDFTRRMSGDEFIRRIADQASLSIADATKQARAVFTALRRAVSDEFFDVAVELPRSYDPVLPSPARSS
jgi:uncharacterized protein (DUF2267 family)